MPKRKYKERVKWDVGEEYRWQLAGFDVGRIERRWIYNGNSGGTHLDCEASGTQVIAER